ncbi:hypothetical protein MMC17_005788 [Xylographa soralifera]|nr:hypothetical protein [Xylographa soralifera]
MYMFYVKQAEAERAAKRALQDRTQVKRASILKDPYASLVLNRQTGLLSSRLRLNSGSVWAQHATRRQILDISKTERPRGIRLPLYNKNDNIVTAIVKDEATGTVFQGYHGSVHFNAGILSCVESWPPRLSHLQEDEYPTSSRRPLLFRQNTEAGDISSLCLSPDRKLCSTTLDATLHINALLPPETIADSTYPIVDSGTYFQPTEAIAHANFHYIDIQKTLTETHNNTIWSSDCSPGSIIGLGTSQGMLMLSLSTEQWCPGSLEKHKDMLAVRWSSTHVLLGGTRKGTVWQSDQRVPVTERLLRHPSPVTGLGMLDNYRVVVAGMNNQLSTYDIRFLRPLPTTAWQKRTRTSSGPHRSHRSIPFHGRIPAATAPYIEYPSYHNIAHGNLGFDVSREMGLVTAATDEGEVKVWDGFTGKERVWGREHCEDGEDRDEVEEDGGREGGKSDRKMGEKEGRGNGRGEGENLVRSLLFTGGGEDGGKGESLLVARGAVVEEWGL